MREGSYNKSKRTKHRNIILNFTTYGNLRISLKFKILIITGTMRRIGGNQWNGITQTKGLKQTTNLKIKEANQRITGRM